ncbi:hypothetical protein D4764_0018140 [Takifugu flavidus]|uniref:Uncharacterized protein n=1 Tax=Takifugu flavidus TaxID=433684 RepID=A0A5C6MLD2_9TELE|nr:hypothetical protein D4764_0018140 [Takifugu flavidus]
MCDLVLVKDRKCVTFVVVRCEKRGNGSVTEHQITGSPDHPITRSRIKERLHLCSRRAKAVNLNEIQLVWNTESETGHLHHGAEPVGRAPSQAPPCPALGDDG